MSRSHRKKRRGFKPKSTDCNLCFFEDTCNQKTAKVCNSFVPADNSLPKAKELRRVVEPLITLESENSTVNNYLCNDIGAPVSSSEYVALIIFAVLLIVGCAYLVWR